MKNNIFVFCGKLVDMNFLESWKVGSENCDNSEFLCNVVGLLLDMCEIHGVGLFFKCMGQVALLCVMSLPYLVGLLCVMSLLYLVGLLCVLSLLYLIGFTCFPVLVQII